MHLLRTNNQNIHLNPPTAIQGLRGFRNREDLLHRATVRINLVGSQLWEVNSLVSLDLEAVEEVCIIRLSAVLPVDLLQD
jgi:hypothetical protein